MELSFDWSSDTCTADPVVAGIGAILQMWLYAGESGYTIHQLYETVFSHKQYWFYIYILRIYIKIFLKNFLDMPGK